MTMKRAKVCALTLATLISMAGASLKAHAQPVAPYYPSIESPYGAPAGPGSDLGAITKPVTVPIMPGSFSGEALFLMRAMPTTQALAVSYNFITYVSVLDVRDLNQGFGTGLGFTGVLQPGWSDIEVRGFEIDSFSNSRSFRDTQMYLPTLDTTNVYQRLDATYYSKLYDGEASLRCPFSDCLSGLIGFRYARLEEEMGLAGGQDIYDISGNIIGTNYTQATSRVTNDLFGFQLGGMFSLGRGTSPVYLDTVVKGAVCSNQIHRERLWSSNLAAPPTDTPYVNQYAGVVAFIGEVSARVTWEIASHLSVFGGYQVLWLSGIADASDHLGRTTVGGIYDTQTTLFHGGMGGFEARW